MYSASHLNKFKVVISNLLTDYLGRIFHEIEPKMVTVVNMSLLAM